MDYIRTSALAFKFAPMSKAAASLGGRRGGGIGAGMMIDLQAIQ